MPLPSNSSSILNTQFLIFGFFVIVIANELIISEISLNSDTAGRTGTPEEEKSCLDWYLEQRIFDFKGSDDNI